MGLMCCPVALSCGAVRISPPVPRPVVHRADRWIPVGTASLYCLAVYGSSLWVVSAYSWAKNAITGREGYSCSLPHIGFE